MPATLQDFINTFAAGANPAAEEAERYHERFVSTDENDRDFDNQAYQQGAAEYLERLPDDQFEEAARTAVAQAPPREREGLLTGLLGALGGSGTGAPGNARAGLGGITGALGGLAGAGGLRGLAQILGLGSTDPREMSEDDAAKLMNYARKENPGALRQTVQEKPWFVKALGNPIVMGALTMAAAKMLSNRGNR